MDDRHVVWSNENLDLEDWRADLEEEYPGYSDDELYEIMCETNSSYLSDERVNLNIQLSHSRKNLCLRSRIHSHLPLKV